MKNKRENTNIVFLKHVSVCMCVFAYFEKLSVCLVKCENINSNTLLLRQIFFQLNELG